MPFLSPSSNSVVGGRSSSRHASIHLRVKKRERERERDRSCHEDDDLTLVGMAVVKDKQGNRSTLESGTPSSRWLFQKVEHEVNIDLRDMD